MGLLVADIRIPQFCVHVALTEEGVNMAMPEVVTSAARSKKIVSTILLTEEPVAVIALTFKTNAITGEI